MIHTAGARGRMAAGRTGAPRAVVLPGAAVLRGVLTLLFGFHLRNPAAQAQPEQGRLVVKVATKPMPGTLRPSPPASTPTRLPAPPGGTPSRREDVRSRLAACAGHGNGAGS